ncbi:MAG: hypothetical protein J0L72_04645 [Armatimonadetes bacterium]|nr:hypothetical protein [Armatimonadota bacterium]
MVIMKVLVFEDNLVWSSRLLQTLRHLGHEPTLMKCEEFEPNGAEVAIVNLGSGTLPAAQIVPKLKAFGVHVIGHSGHKEKGLQASGAELGCDQVVSNSQLTFKLDQLLANISGS